MNSATRAKRSKSLLLGLLGAGWIIGNILTLNDFVSPSLIERASYWLTSPEAFEDTSSRLSEIKARMALASDPTLHPSRYVEFRAGLAIRPEEDPEDYPTSSRMLIFKTVRDEEPEHRLNIPESAVTPPPFRYVNLYENL